MEPGLDKITIFHPSKSMKKKKRRSPKPAPQVPEEDPADLSYWIPSFRQTILGTSTNVTGADHFFVPLKVSLLDLNVMKNNELHHTDRFLDADNTLTVRRGATFTIHMRFDREICSDVDRIVFRFEMPCDGFKQVAEECKVRLNLYEGGIAPPSKWGAIVDEQRDAKTLRVIIRPSCRSPVGIWRMYVDTFFISPGVVQTNRYSVPRPVQILFNPWSEDDETYMSGIIKPSFYRDISKLRPSLPDEAAINEYVMSTSTIFWHGTFRNAVRELWGLDQRKQYVLVYSLQLLMKIQYTYEKTRGKADQIVRKLTSLMHTADRKDGVVSVDLNLLNMRKYPMVRPELTSSKEVLKVFFETGKPYPNYAVSLIPCVITTICRVAGIPTRMVTCYETGIESDISLSIDIIYNEKDEARPYENERVVPSHIFNEVWLRRSDLDPNGDYDGWQAIDGTPFIKSGSLHQCGPASVEAVKAGEVAKRYDADSFLSKVNADVISWRHHANRSDPVLIDIDTMATGKLIITKAIGSSKPEVITSNYKHEEGTAKERKQIEDALRLVNNNLCSFILNSEFNDVKFNLLAPTEPFTYGMPIIITGVVENKTKDKAYDTFGYIKALTFNEALNQQLKLAEIEYKKNSAPETIEQVGLSLPFESYFESFGGEIIATFSGHVLNGRTLYDYNSRVIYKMHRLYVELMFRGEPTMNRKVKLRVSFVNPVHKKLVDGRFYLHIIASEAENDQTVITTVGDVPPEERAKHEFEYVIPNKGFVIFSVKFGCKQIPYDVTQSKIIKVDIDHRKVTEELTDIQI